MSPVQTDSGLREGEAVSGGIGNGEGEISISDLLVYIHPNSLVRSCVDLDKNAF